MKKKQALYNITRIVSILFSLFILLLTTSAAEASSVTLRWDPISGSSDGYRVFARESGQGYNYSQHAWQGSASTCTVNNLQDQTEYYFVVRAFDGSITSTNSNEVHYVPPAANTPAPVPTNGVLGSKFAETTLTGGVEYYTDRSYQLTGVPSSYDNMDAIITPNDDRNRTDASGYVTFTMPYAGTVYVAFDSRATSLPNWMNGFVNTGDVLRTSLSSQPSLKIYRRSYSSGAIVNFGGNKAAGFAGGTVSNYIIFYGNINSSATTPSSNPTAPSSNIPAPSGVGVADLSARFSETTLAAGVEYYTDRGYQLTGVPSPYENMDAIITPNVDRNRTDVRDYLTFTMPYDGAVYVAYDARATSLPNWMNGFVNTGDVLRTSLSSQPSLKIYRRSYSSGAIVNFGGNKAAGFAGGTVSNYIIFYGNINSSATTPSSNPTAPSSNIPAPSGVGVADLSARFSETTLAAGVEYYTDRGYQLTGVPSPYENMDAIITPNVDRNRTDVRDYLTFTMPYDGAVYVAYDARATSLPQWMNGFVDTGDTLETSLSTQPYLRIFVHNYSQGDVINLGANKAPGFAGTASNYIVFYSWTGR